MSLLSLVKPSLRLGGFGTVGADNELFRDKLAFPVGTPRKRESESYHRIAGQN